MQTLTRSKFQHVIARSVATGQSVLLAVQHHRKQYFGRIRKMLRIRPSSTFLHTQIQGRARCVIEREVFATAGMVVFQHVIARSAATWQSVLLAAQHRRKQYFRRIRKMLRIRPRQHILAHADTPQVSACHCEERSDVAIRSPCSTASQKAVL